MIEAMKEMNWKVKDKESTLTLKEFYEVPFFTFEHLEKPDPRIFYENGWCEYR